MFNFIAFLAGLVLSLTSSPVSAQQPPPCNQTDQLAQVRCQLQQALQKGNLGLADRLFATSPYADPNDVQACGRRSYLVCALGSGSVEIVKMLFDRGLDPNLRVVLNHHLINLVVDYPSQDDLVIRAVELMLEKGLNLDDQLMPGSDMTVVEYILTKCFQPHNRYPKYNEIIFRVFRFDFYNDDKQRMLNRKMREVANKPMRGMDTANCKELAK